MENPTYRLEIESLDLGADVRAVGLEFIDPETREPVIGAAAARAWAAMLPALASGEPWRLDFFTYVERIRDFCHEHGIAFHEPDAHVLVIRSPTPEQLEALIERFADETFGMRAGAAVVNDAGIEGGLAERGVDAYHEVFSKYLFCAVCDFADGFLTLLSERLWTSEVIRRVRKAVTDLHVEVVRPA